MAGFLFAQLHYLLHKAPTQLVLHTFVVVVPDLIAYWFTKATAQLVSTPSAQSGPNPSLHAHAA